MTFGEMLILTNRLKEIDSSKLPEDLKSDRLAVLQSDIKARYKHDQYAASLQVAISEIK